MAYIIVYKASTQKQFKIVMVQQNIAYQMRQVTNYKHNTSLITENNDDEEMI